jgi:nitroreductase
MRENMKPESIIEALKWRYAVQTFDPAKPILPEQLNAILESGRLAPSSFGLEPWKFVVVENPEVRAKLRAVSYGQSKVTDAAALIVLAYRTDLAESMGRERVERMAKAQGQSVESFGEMKQRADSLMAGLVEKGTATEWARVQTGIAFGMMIETAALLGVDAGPMEGFSADDVDAILGLKEKNLRASCMLTVGHRGADPAAVRPKVRRSLDEVIEFVR